MNTPIANAVAPLKQQAMDRAELAVTERIEAALAQLAAVGNDLNKVAPQPHGMMGRATYKQAQALRAFLEAITVSTQASRRHGEPNLRVVAPGGIARLVSITREEAAGSYEAFVAKLEQKVGDHRAAALDGSSVWGHSVLHVTTPAGAQRWVTKQILNVSVLGKLFNQWPTRLAK